MYIYNTESKQVDYSKWGANTICITWRSGGLEDHLALLSNLPQTVNRPRIHKVRRVCSTQKKIVPTFMLQFLWTTPTEFELFLRSTPKGFVDAHAYDLRTCCEAQYLRYGCYDKSYGKIGLSCRATDCMICLLAKPLSDTSGIVCTSYWMGLFMH